MGSIDIEVGLTAEEVAVRDTVHKFAVDVLRPAGAKLDKLTDPADVVAPGSILWEVFEKYHQLGIPGLRGDPSVDAVARARLGAIVNEELSWGDVGLAITLGLCGFHEMWVRTTGNAELIERFCDPDRPTIGCWALTEPDHGSDTVAVTEPHFSDPSLRANCVARKDGDDYVISGQKAAWVSNGSIADIAVLFCTLDASQGFKGGGVFLVPLDLPGVSRGPPARQARPAQPQPGRDLLRRRAGARQLHGGGPGALRDRPRDDARLRQRGDGPALRRRGARGLRPRAGLREGARPGRRADHRAPERKRSRLFRMFMKVEAARALARRVAVFNAAGAPRSSTASPRRSSAPAPPSRSRARRCRSSAATGSRREYPIEKLLRDARASLIEDGCNEVLEHRRRHASSERSRRA